MLNVFDNSWKSKVSVSVTIHVSATVSVDRWDKLKKTSYFHVYAQNFTISRAGSQLNKHLCTQYNPCLFQDVINYNCRALVASVPFFANADPSFVSEVVPNLHYEVFQPGE